MRKFAIFLAAALALSITAVAYAQTQQNTYAVSGSTSPTKAGTSKKPVNVEVKFGYTVGEVNGNRPSPVKKYGIAFAGLIANTSAFPKCSTATLEDQGPSGCPSGSKVGDGFITNATGSSTNIADKSVQCNAALTVYNSGNNKGVIYVAGNPASTNPKTRCAIELAAPIPARFIRSSNGTTTTMEFTVPPSLLHPVPNSLDNAVTSVTSTISDKTRKYKGKKVSFFQSIGGCKNGKRNITVRFTPENGSAATAQKLATCKK